MIKGLIFAIISLIVSGQAFDFANVVRSTGPTHEKYF
jgi:hypothetical protein